jgi:hypothetical protein
MVQVTLKNENAINKRKSESPEITPKQKRDIGSNGPLLKKYKTQREQQPQISKIKEENEMSESENFSETSPLTLSKKKSIHVNKTGP